MPYYFYIQYKIDGEKVTVPEDWLDENEKTNLKSLPEFEAKRLYYFFYSASDDEPSPSEMAGTVTSIPRFNDEDEQDKKCGGSGFYLATILAVDDDEEKLQARVDGAAGKRIKFPSSKVVQNSQVLDGAPKRKSHDQIPAVKDNKTTPGPKSTKRKVSEGNQETENSKNKVQKLSGDSTHSRQHAKKDRRPVQARQQSLFGSDSEVEEDGDFSSDSEDDQTVMPSKQYLALEKEYVVLKKQMRQLRKINIDLQQKNLLYQDHMVKCSIGWQVALKSTSDSNAISTTPVHTLKQTMQQKCLSITASSIEFKSNHTPRSSSCNNSKSNLDSISITPRSSSCSNSKSSLQLVTPHSCSRTVQNNIAGRSSPAAVGNSTVRVSLFKADSTPQTLSASGSSSNKGGVHSLPVPVSREAPQPTSPLRSVENLQDNDVHPLPDTDAEDGIEVERNPPFIEEDSTSIHPTLFPTVYVSKKLWKKIEGTVFDDGESQLDFKKTEDVRAFVYRLSHKMWGPDVLGRSTVSGKDSNANLNRKDKIIDSNKWGKQALDVNEMKIIHKALMLRVKIKNPDLSDKDIEKEWSLNIVKGHIRNKINNIKKILLRAEKGEAKIVDENTESL